MINNAAAGREKITGPACNMSKHTLSTTHTPQQQTNTYKHKHT